MIRARLFGPVVEIRRLQSEINRLFAGILASQSVSAGAASWDPSVDLIETDEEVRLVMELPGVAAGDLTIRAQSGSVLVRGRKRSEERPNRGVRFLCMERSFGEFEKAIVLPAPVNLRRASARFRDGLLIVTFPRVVDQRRRSFDIPVTDDGS
jgi:HSP20 family protein